MNPEDDFNQRLDQALSAYADAIALVDTLLAERRSAQEIILLTCARLDSLANLATEGAVSQQKSFRRFVSNYSGQSQKRFFNSISVGDLYFYLIRYGDLADGLLVEKPGRIKRFGSDSDGFLAFVEKSQVSITGESIRQLSHRVAQTLAKQFRVKPRQRLSKAYRASSTQIRRVIAAEFRKPEPSQINQALGGLLDRFKASSILYKRYRCGVIHGFRVDIDEGGFFEETMPFHTEVDTIFGPMFTLEFPGQYLRDILSKCLKTYTHQLRSQRTLPIDLYSEMYTFDEMLDPEVIDYLGEGSLEDLEDVRWNLKNR